MLQSEKAVKPTEGRNLFGTAVKVADSAYSKRLANVQCKVDSRSVKKNILGDLEPHAKAGIKKEVAKITTAKKTVQNLKAAKIVKPIVKPLLKPALKSAVKGIGQNKKVAKKVTGPAFDQGWFYFSFSSPCCNI